MKKLVFFLLIAVLFSGALFAQAWGYGGNAQQITVNGRLQLQNGEIAVASGTNIYFVPTLGRYVGFIDDIKAGAQVSIEGYAYGNVLEPVKVTINGNSYDFAASSNQLGGGFGYGNGYNSFCGGGCWGWGGGFGTASGSRGGMMGRRW